MNALVSFRANTAGNLTPSRAEREEAVDRITSNLRAQLTGLRAAAAAKSGASVAKTDMSDGTGAALPNNELGRDAFLQLLVLELQNQDPTAPMDNTQMIAQLAQFSALEASTNLNETFTDFADSFDVFSGNMDQLNFISAQGLLGKYVEGVNEAGDVVRGTVESVHLSGSIVVLTVNGEVLPMTGVLGVAPYAPEDGGK